MTSLAERLAAARRAHSDQRVEADPDAGQEWNPEDQGTAEPGGHAQTPLYGSTAEGDAAREEDLPAPVMGKRRADVAWESAAQRPSATAQFLDSQGTFATCPHVH